MKRKLSTLIPAAAAAIAALLVAAVVVAAMLTGPGTAMAKGTPLSPAFRRSLLVS